MFKSSCWPSVSKMKCFRLSLCSSSLKFAKLCTKYALRFSISSLFLKQSNASFRSPSNCVTPSSSLVNRFRQLFCVISEIGFRFSYLTFAVFLFIYLYIDTNLQIKGDTLRRYAFWA